MKSGEVFRVRWSAAEFESRRQRAGLRRGETTLHYMVMAF